MFTPDRPPVPHCPNCSLTEGRAPKIGSSPLTMKSGRFTPDSNGPPCEPDENGYRLLLPTLMLRPNKHSVPAQEPGSMIVTSLNWPGINPGWDFVVS